MQIVKVRQGSSEGRVLIVTLPKALLDTMPPGKRLQVGDYVSVTVNAGAQSDPQATAQAVAEILPEALLEAIERIQMETGG